MRVVSVANLSVDSSFLRVDLDKLVSWLRDQKLMEDANTGDTQVVDSKGPAYFEVIIRVVIVDDWLGERMRAIN